MIDTFPGFDPPVQELMALASTPLEPSIFRLACQRFAKFKADSSDEDRWYFKIGDSGANLIVGLEVEPAEKGENGRRGFRGIRVTCAIMSICWWETCWPSMHKDMASYYVEQRQFDRLYAESYERSAKLLGAPWKQGIDLGPSRHRWAIWRGSTSLLVLQQSAYDPQFGLDVNYWIHPWPGGDIMPTSPFIDWLCGSTSDGSKG